MLQKYLAFLKRANRPILEDEQRIVSGRVALTVSPNTKAEKPDSFRLEFPSDYNEDEAPYAFSLLMSVFDPEPLSHLIPKIGPAMKSKQKISQQVGQWRFQTFLEGENYVILIEAMHS